MLARASMPTNSCHVGARKRHFGFAYQGEKEGTVALGVSYTTLESY